MSKAFLRHKEPVSRAGSRIRDFILGGQDGLVNVLGVVLGVATATADTKIVLIAALAAAFAESISMGAVAYTSFKAEKEYYLSEVAREKREMKEVPLAEKKEIEDIYRKFGFTGSLLKKIVNHITSNKKRWLAVMMAQELRLYPSKVSPANSALVVGIAAIVGSLIPVMPFLFMAIGSAVWTALVISTLVLFLMGFYAAKTTIGNPWKSGAELATIGMLAALVGYGVGAVLGVAVH